MKEVIRIIEEANISKVNVAKFLGVSRQMLYNYLSFDNIDDLPLDKQSRLLGLFGVKNEKDLAKIKVDESFVESLELRINEGINDTSNKESISDFKGLNKDEQQVLTDIISILKDRLVHDDTGIEYKTLLYLQMFIQNMAQLDEFKYLLAYLGKSTAQVPMLEYLYDENKQYVFEGIFFSADSLFAGNNVSKARVAESHKKWERKIEQMKEDKLSRTQELTNFKQQALKELGYSYVNESNAKEVFEKIAEIMSRKI